MILEKIKKENDIKKLSPQELEVLAEEIREFLIEKISETGGHLASNLGVVELTMALHLAFEWHYTGLLICQRIRLSGMWDTSPIPIRYLPGEKRDLMSFVNTEE